MNNSNDQPGVPAGQPVAPAGQPDPAGITAGQAAETADDELRVNLLLTWFLGLALLGLIGAVIKLALANKGALPDGLTTLASLIAGGLLAALNPIRGTSQGKSGPAAGRQRKSLLHRHP